MWIKLTKHSDEFVSKISRKHKHTYDENLTKNKKIHTCKKVVAVAYGIIITVNNISTATTMFSRKNFFQKKKYKHTYPLLALSSHDDTMVLLAISLKKFHVKKKDVSFEKIANDNSRFLYSLLLICFVVVVVDWADVHLGLKSL